MNKFPLSSIKSKHIRSRLDHSHLAYHISHLTRPNYPDQNFEVTRSQLVATGNVGGAKGGVWFISLLKTINVI